MTVIVSKYFGHVFYRCLCDETDAADATTTLPQLTGCGDDMPTMDHRRDQDGFRDKNPIFKRWQYNLNHVRATENICSRLNRIAKQFIAISTRYHTDLTDSKPT